MNDVATAPVTVVVPTIGRPQLLAACLDSIAQCRPRPREVLVVDQSTGPETVETVRVGPLTGARRLPSQPPAVSIALNAGLRAASYEIVFITNDDCTVAPSWIDVGWRLASENPARIVTGRVLPAGDEQGVPSTITSTQPEDLTGRRICDRLYGGNMVLNRQLALQLGGFDEILVDSASDNDFGYRWLKSGGQMRYEPDLVVWHHDWRSPSELRDQYVRYARGRGAFYGKSLRDGDLGVLRFLAEDVASWARAVVEHRRGRKPGCWPDERLVIMPSLPRGMLYGWRAAGSRRRSGAG